MFNKIQVLYMHAFYVVFKFIMQTMLSVIN